MTTYALIMAGGSGTRLWPRSRTSRPKQFLDLTGELTMLQEAQQRLLPLIPPSNVLIATNQAYTDLASQQLPEVPKENILGEPEGRGTAAAIGLAAVHLRKRDPDAVMVVLTADHLIQHKEVFRRVLAAAVEVAQEGWLTTIGIKPDYPETGYGYVERGELLSHVGGFDVYRVARFVEKPGRALAEEFFANNRYSWNSGMFVWRVSRILEEMERHMPSLYSRLSRIEEAIGTSHAEETFKRVWPGIATEMIDYGVMEKADRVAVLPADIGWKDMGSWTAVYDVLPHDKEGNAIVGKHISHDTHGSLIYSPNRLVATVGLEDMIVVDTGDALLICPRSRAQEVKQLVDQLKQSGMGDYLKGERQ